MHHAATALDGPAGGGVYPMPSTDITPRNDCSGNAADHGGWGRHGDPRTPGS